MATNFVVPDEIGLRMILIEPKKDNNNKEGLNFSF